MLVFLDADHCWVVDDEVRETVAATNGMVQDFVDVEGYVRDSVHHPFGVWSFLSGPLQDVGWLRGTGQSRPRSSPVEVHPGLWRCCGRHGSTGVDLTRCCAE